MADELQDLAMVALEQPPPRPLHPLVQQCHRLLHRRMRVGVSDGRFFVGKFHCLDKQGNIILYDALEYRQPPLTSSSQPPLEQRGLGLVLIPARCRTSCFVECSLDEQLSLLSLQDA